MVPVSAVLVIALLVILLIINRKNKLTEDTEKRSSFDKNIVSSNFRNEEPEKRNRNVSFQGLKRKISRQEGNLAVNNYVYTGSFMEKPYINSGLYL